MRERIYAKVSSELLTQLDTIATEEQRPRSQMVAVLLAEAIAGREFASRMNEVSDEDRARFVAKNMSMAEWEAGIRESAVPQHETQDFVPVPVDEPLDESIRNYAGPPPKRHFHKYDSEHFVREVEPVKGTRMGLYQCGCGEQKTQPLDGWSRAVVDTQTAKTD